MNTAVPSRADHTRCLTTLFAIVLATTCLACDGSSSERSVDAGPEPSTDGGPLPPDAGERPGAPIEGPLLSKPGAITTDCTVTQPTTRLFEQWVGGVPLVLGDLAYLARIEAGVGVPITWSTLDVAGKLGAATALHNSETFQDRLRAATHGDTATLLYVESQAGEQQGDLHKVRLAQVRADAPDTVVPTDLSEQAMYSPSGSITATESGYAVLWTDGGDDHQKLMFARLDAQAKIVGERKVAYEGSELLTAGALVSTPTGFALTYTQQTDDGWSQLYLTLDEEGDPVGTAHDLGQGYRSDLIRQGDSVIAAWSLRGGTPQKQHSVIRIARFKSDGELAGSMFDLQAPEDDKSNTSPRWVAIGQDLGLLWGHASVIYVCAGCIPDDTLRFVVLDGSTFAPRSKVLELSGAPYQGGLTAPQIVAQGDDLLITSNIEYHVSADGAFAGLRCVR